MKRLHVLSVMAAGLLILGDMSAQAAEKFVSIGTGGVNGVYYPAGGAICRLVNRARKEHGIRCSVESTGGSISNLNGIIQGDIDMGIVQSDMQYDAYNGSGLFANQGPNRKLRTLFSLHGEPFTVLVRSDSDVKTFDDLRNHRVNIGDPGSGVRATMEEIMKAKGWTRNSFSKVSELKPEDQGQALCSGKIDVMVFAAGHPNGLVQDTTSLCDVRLVPFSEDDILKMTNRNPYYAPALIPGGMYQGNPADVKTFGVVATLVASDKLDSEAAYQVVKAVFENFYSFKTLHFVFASLDRNKMVTDGIVAPLHEGAVKYYQEVGLISKDAAIPANAPFEVKSSVKPEPKGHRK